MRPAPDGFAVAFVALLVLLVGAILVMSYVVVPLIERLGAAIDRLPV